MYRERASRLAGAVVWARTVGPGAVRPVLPDGCMDLLWRDGRLFVAGPDTHAYVPDAAAGCADQAHLAREMRDLAGTTLTAYAEAAKSETPTPSGSWSVA